MVDRTQLEEGFRRLGIATGDLLEVHASLSSFGRVVGGAPTVVDTLMTVVGARGALLVPAHPCLTSGLPLTTDEEARGIRYKCRVLPEAEAPVFGMGAIADELLRRE